MSIYVLFWCAWGLAFLVVEGIGLLNRRDGDTLSEQFWRAFHVYDRRPTPVVIGARVLLGLFGLWLTVHMTFGTMTLSHPMPW